MCPIVRINSSLKAPWSQQSGAYYLDYYLGTETVENLATTIEKYLYVFLQIRGVKSDWEGQFRPGCEGLRPQVSPPRRPQDGQEREKVPPTGAGRDQDLGTPQETGQGQLIQHHSHVSYFSLRPLRLIYL